MCKNPRPTNEFFGYRIKQSDVEVLGVLEFSGMQSTPSFPSLPSVLSAGVVEPDSALSMGLIVLICIKLDWALNKLQRLIWHKTQTINQLVSVNLVKRSSTFQMTFFQYTWDSIYFLFSFILVNISFRNIFSIII